MQYHVTKCMDPPDLGILYAKKKWLEELPPYQGGGGMIKGSKKRWIFHMEICQINMKQGQWRQHK